MIRVQGRSTVPLVFEDTRRLGGFGEVHRARRRRLIWMDTRWLNLVDPQNRRQQSPHHEQRRGQLLPITGSIGAIVGRSGGGRIVDGRG